MKNNNNKKNNPKLKTGETVSRFELHSPLSKPFRGERLLENQNINQAGLSLDQKIEISEQQPPINLLFNRLRKVECRLTHKPEMLKRGNMENQKSGNQQIWNQSEAEGNTNN